MTKTTLRTGFLSLFLLFMTGCCQSDKIDILSPSGSIKVHVGQNPENKGLSYTVHFLKEGRETEAILASPLGISYDNEDFSKDLSSLSFEEITRVRDTFNLISGKRSTVRTTYNQTLINAENPNGKRLQIAFRVYDDGVAFQYRLPGEGTVTIESEETGFHIPTGGKGWMHPYDKVTDWSPGYETPCANEIVIGAKAPEKMNGWAFPLLFHTNGLWLLISEAGTEAFSYGATHVDNTEEGIYGIRFAEADEARGLCPNKPTVRLPFSTNWRAIICGDSPATVVETDMIQALNPPCAYTDLSWIKTGLAAWSWWGFHDSPKDYDQMLPFIDMASELKWPYFLVDANWNLMKNGDLEKITDYAAQKGVDIFAWYNTGGPNNVVTEQPRDRMFDSERRKEEMRWLRNIGVKGMKIDFFQSDKPCVTRLYEEILRDAMENRLMVNFHGCTLPKGWERSYPNLMTMEAVMGEECYAFQSGYPLIAPALNATIPFCRNAVGPVDYTPTSFTHQKFERKTTAAHELALAVLFQSGITHVADRTQGILSTPTYVRDMLSGLPASWDDTRFLHGYPGKEVVLARKSGDRWYIAGINGEDKGKTLSFSIPFLKEGMEINIIKDGEKQDEFLNEIIHGPKAQELEVETLPYGGFLMKIK